MLVTFYRNFPDLLNWIHFFVGQQKIKVENNSLLYQTIEHRNFYKQEQKFSSRLDHVYMYKWKCCQMATDWQTNWWNICFTDWLCEDTRMGDSGDLVVCFSAVVMTLRIMLSVVSAMHINIYYAVIVFIWPHMLSQASLSLLHSTLLLRYSSFHWEKPGNTLQLSLEIIVRRGGDSDHADQVNISTLFRNWGSGEHSSPT